MKEIFTIVPANLYRTTKDVDFHFIPIVPNMKSIDRVKHGINAISPGSVGDVKNPWYMHPHQMDNLIVFYGTRYVELYTKERGLVQLEVTPEKIMQNGKVLYEGPALLFWDTYVFHRINSGSEGSMSVNFAQRTNDFDIKNNFNIYDLNLETGEYSVIREGHIDQKDIFPE